jgi:hypothetical protein
LLIQPVLEWADDPLGARRPHHGAAPGLESAMHTGYMPRADTAAMQWMLTFSRGLVDQPGVYHTAPQEAAAVQDAVDAFVDAMVTATEPATRTRGAVAAKDNARALAERTCRPVYARIKSDPTISDQDKINIGVRRINPHRTRINAPLTAPVLNLVEITTSGHVIGFADTDSVRRGKPFGATQLQLFRRFEQRPAEPVQLVGCFTRSPMRVDCDRADNGLTAIYEARWMTRRAEAGPLSRPLTAPVVAVAPTFAARQAA